MVFQPCSRQSGSLTQNHRLASSSSVSAGNRKFKNYENFRFLEAELVSNEFSRTVAGRTVIFCIWARSELDLFQRAQTSKSTIGGVDDAPLFGYVL